MSEDPHHNLIEVAALIAALTDDLPGVAQQMEALDRSGLVVLIGACGHVRDAAWLKLRELEGK